MSKTIVKNRMLVLSALVCAALSCAPAFAKKASPELVKEEAGYYYGYGKGATKEEAEFAARKDLVETALTSTVRLTNPKSGRISVSNESAKARLGNIKPYVADKPGTNVTYRIKVQDWEKDEKAFSEKLRKSVEAKYEGLSTKKNFAEIVNDSVELLSILASNGETELLTVQAGATELMARRIEAVCSNLVKNLVITISVKDGFIGADSVFSVTASDASGKPVSGLMLKALWEVPSVPGTADKEIQEIVSTVKTDSIGNATVDYPVDENYRNNPVTLTVSTAFSASAQATAAMKKLDAASAVDGNYVYYEDFAASHGTAAIAAGEFNAGAVAHDNKASKREASRPVMTGAYAMMLKPVTNADYAAYLHVTRSSQAPEYFDNSDYNNGEQPVVGVSAADAEAYAAWLSEQTGRVYRLPTQEEWEKAARAGKDVIYPWGDEAPNKAKSANYKGNGKFKAPSPVGSFENGNNELGLTDMAGNVWEWTSSKYLAEDDPSLRTTKGGSWMDGPTDLRISNYRNVNGESGYPDVGFRLVMEVTE